VVPGDSGGAAASAPVFASSAEFEVLMPVLAEETHDYRRQFRGAGLRAMLARGRDYAFDQASREQINEALGYSDLADAVEEERRREALDGARLLLRDVEAARANELLHEGLLGDAFGIAAWAIGVRPGEEAVPERLALLADLRLRFVLGFAAPAATATLA
jgi:hypothetical protein